MKQLSILLFTATLIIIGATVALSATEREIPLSEVPEKILEAAQRAVPGIKLTEAEVEETKDGLVYEIEGMVDDKEYEIEVSADGEVLEVESVEDDDEGEHGEDDDDEGGHDDDCGEKDEGPDDD
jgi:hypothetical protein